MPEGSDCPTPHSLAGGAAAWQSLVSAFMAHAAVLPDRLATATRAAPESPALLAAKGLIFLLLGQRERTDEARALLKAAREALGPGAGLHDRLMVDALGAWLSGRPSRAAAIFDEILAATPGDGFALKMAQAIRFLYGDSAGMRRSAEAAVGAFADTHPHAGYARGCYAFACEETGDYGRAEREGRRAVELAPDDAWGLHAVAHVHEMRGEPEKGRAWLAGRTDTFAGCSNFSHHVWWHYALFEMELGNVDAVLDLYDRQIRREPTDDYRDIANAVSLLARLEADGIDVGHRWDELAALAQRRMDDACIVFADLHYLMALVASGRHEAADRMIARMARSQDGSEFGAIAVGAGAPAGSGLAALGRGNHSAAFEGLLAARRRLQAIGGSRAQRDVFERLTIDAAIGAGKTEVARTLVRERAVRRGSWDRFGIDRLVRCGPLPVAVPSPTAAAF